MSGERFTLDTNILVYSMDRDAGLKRDIACGLLKAAVRLDCSLTLQSMSEFYSAATRKRGVPPEAARAQVLDWMGAFPILPATESCVREALGIAVGRQASYYDALIIVTAAEGGCTAMVTEDMADETVVAGVRIVNPFGPAGMTEAAARLLTPT